MRTNLLLTRLEGARPLAVRLTRSTRDDLAVALVGAGTFLLPVAMFLPWYRDAGWLPPRSERSSRGNLAGILAAAGALLLPVAMSLPWYRDADAASRTLSAWGGYWFVIAGMLVLLVGGAWLALSVLAGRPLRGPALDVISGFAFVVTITVVIALFIARPGGNAATAVAIGGFIGLAAINTIKGGAILMAINARRRMISRPAPA